jgi:hypothetical protein
MFFFWFPRLLKKLCTLLKLLWTSCIMHRCVISTMFGSCVWFFKKTFIFSNNRWSPPCPGPSHFPLRLFTPSTPPPPSPSHFPLRFFNPSSPPPSPSHFPLRFFNPSIPPRPVLHISHSSSLTFWFRFLRTQQEQKNCRFPSCQQPCRADGFCGRIATSLVGSLTLSLFWGR